ncbi:hypothetical protein SASPL_104487 [Salvia splendens]|uniref:Fatty acid hydroxylase domain-containing protein n=1 Tax=Salvia splendens TaxID=180675 RepID=A0A8X9A8G6_SALSN|nr:hypothetical protein SASPL_104487 [Salvia splendens]
MQICNCRYLSSIQNVLPVLTFLLVLPYHMKYVMLLLFVQTKSNTVDAQEKCISRLLLYHIPSSDLWACEVPFRCHPGILRKVISTQILFYFILEDFVFYWGHRILHTKWLYKHVHSVHHEYATPFGLTSEYAHPAEILFLGFATILGPHLITLWLWMVLRVLETVEAHLLIFTDCYTQRVATTHQLLSTWTGEFSDSLFSYDHSLYTLAWIFGTDTGYRKLKALKSEGEEMSMKDM